MNVISVWINKPYTIGIVNDLPFDVTWMEVNMPKRKAKIQLREM